MCKEVRAAQLLRSGDTGSAPCARARSQAQPSASAFCVSLREPPFPQPEMPKHSQVPAERRTHKHLVFSRGQICPVQPCIFNSKHARVWTYTHSSPTDVNFKS